MNTAAIIVFNQSNSRFKATHGNTISVLQKELYPQISHIETFIDHTTLCDVTINKQVPRLAVGLKFRP